MALFSNRVVHKLLLAAIFTISMLIVQRLIFHNGVPRGRNPDPEIDLESQMAWNKMQKTNGEAFANVLTPIRHVKQNASLAYKDLRQSKHIENQQEVTALLNKLVSLLGTHGRQGELKDLLTVVKSDASFEETIKKQVAGEQVMYGPQSKTNIKVRTTASGKIPKILHMTFASIMVPKNYLPLIENCLHLNPDWKFYLWTDSDIDVLIARHLPVMLKTVKRFKHKLEKSDALRYVVLYVFGGIYIDMDVECKKPFFPSLSKQRAFLDQEHPIHANLLYGWSFTAMNSAMGAEPRHPFFMRIIEKIALQKDFGSPTITTGPIMMTNELKEYRKSPQFKEHPIELLPHYVMSPEPDRLQNFRYICTFKKHVDTGKKKIKERKVRELSLGEEACLSLELLDWKLVVETRPETVAVHRFMHLGYPENVARRRLIIVHFNASQQFQSRINFYSKEKPLTTEELLNVLTKAVI